MQLRLIRHLWGTQGTWENLFPEFKALGYHGIEGHVPPQTDRERFRALLDQYQFEFVAQIFTRGHTVEEHLRSFADQLAEAETLRPRLVNAHSGRDAWDETEALRFFTGALELESRTSTPVAHETHRGRILFHPWITYRILARLPNLRLCCDFSHWVCVAERLLDDASALLRAAAARCQHVHARVGYAQGPQVPDPRAPEYAAELAAHEQWWDWIWDAQTARGDATSTLTPEFGPPPYQHTLPFTEAPVSLLPAVCDWMAQRQQERFQRRPAAA